jgi:hypothetical protein
MRVVTCLLLAAAPLLAQDQGEPMAAPPTLPHTSAENWTAKRFKLPKSAVIYDTWASNRKKLADAPRGTIVRGLGKLSVVYEPDVVTITEPMPRLGLKSGDTILRYTEEGEGFGNFWIKGRWYKELDGTFISEPDTNGCSKNCSGKTTTLGRKEEWSHVRMQDGRLGWIRDY